MEAKAKEKHLTGGVFDCLYDEYFTLLNPQNNLYEFLGYTAKEVELSFHNHLLEYIYIDDRQTIREEISKQLAFGNVFMYENRLTTKTGDIRWVWISAELREGGKKYPYFHCIFHDITDMKKNQEKLTLNEQRYEIVLSQMQDIIFELDCKTFDIYYSPSFEKKFGYQIPIKRFPDSMFESDIIYEADKVELREKFHSLLKGQDRIYHEFRIKNRDGHYLWADVHATAMRDAGGNTVKILGIISDIHAHKTEILETRKIASLDPLTGLLNRRECIRRINHYIEESSALAAFLLIDIDNFKTLNDTLGHLYGDAMLSEFAEDLLAVFRKADVVARIGGDEFVVFMPHIQEKDNLFPKLGKVLRLFQKSSFSEEKFSIGCSIGICFYPEHGSDFTVLFSKADSAMYYAKKHGKDNYCIYNGEEMPSQPPASDHKPLLPMQNNFHGYIMEYIFRIFLEHQSNQTALPIILDFIGRTLRADRIYICQQVADGNFENTYSWYSAGTPPMEASLKDIYTMDWKISPVSPMAAFCSTEEVTDPKIREWFESREVKAAFLCWLGDGKKLSNLIVFKDCHKPREKINEVQYSLFIISKILNLFLVKEFNTELIQKRREERVSFLMDSIPGGMIGIYLKKDFPLYFINPRMLDYLGFRDQKEYSDFIGGNVSNGIYPEDREAAISYILEALTKTDEYEAEYRMMKKNGDLIWINEKGKRIRTIEGREAIISLCIDISEQKEYENQLSIYRNASNGGTFMIRIDDDYTLLYGNDIFYQVFEISPEEMTARQNRAVTLIHPDDIPNVKKAIDNALQNHQPDAEYELKSLTGSGKIKWIFITGTFEKKDNFLVMNGFVIDVTEKHLLENEIVHKELVYRTALKETNVNIWEYDIKNHVLMLTESAEEHHAFSGQLEGIPQSLLDLGYVHPSSSRDLMEMYQRLEQGAPQAQADILTKLADQSGWWWERIHYTAIYDENQRPVYAVAVGEDITQQREAEVLYQQEYQLRMTLNEGVLLSFQCDLDKNHVEYLNGPDSILYGENLTYEDLLCIHNQYIANKEDLARFLNMVNRQALYDAYSRGNTRFNCEYRRKGKDGHLCWVNASARLMRSAQDGNLCLYGTLQDINDSKNLELTLKKRVERDPLTDTYNKETAIQMIGEAIETAQKHRSSYAMLIFNVDNFARIIYDGGYIAADQILKELGEQLTTRSLRSQITGRLYGDEFVVFLYENPSSEEVLQYAENIRRAINMPYMFPQLWFPVSISVGIVFSSQEYSSFSELYRKTKAALSAAKAGGRNNCQVYTVQMEAQFSSGEAKHLTTSRSSAIVDKAGENVLLQCLLALATSTDFRQAMELILKKIAQYYDADRVYVVEVEQNVSKLKNVYEWKKENMLSINAMDSLLLQPQNLSAFIKGQLTTLQYIENVDLVQSRDPQLYQQLKNNGIISFFIANLAESGVTIGYIGIDNPRKNSGNAFIVNDLRYFLANELIKRRLWQHQEFLSCHDELTGMLNRSSYKNYNAAFDEEKLISLGIASLDINGLKEINLRYGNSYGDDIVRSIAKILEMEFTSSQVYRFTGDEFLVICENIAFEAFAFQIEDTREKLKDLCSFSLGSAWSDTDINLGSLIRSADERRLIAKQNYYDDEQYTITRRNHKLLTDLLNSVRQRRFLIYLQPKIDSRGNRIHGAEALVRYQDSDGSLIPPGKFIPYLETANLIHHIDFYVFEEVCRLLAAWNSRGIAPVPISLNFSRSTLLEENLISRIEKTASKYKIDKSLIEIEITESLGEMELSTITFIGNQILQAGYRLSLDDFGAKYSNIAFLSAIHFNALKLDKKLVNNLISNENAKIIVKNILNLCQELDTEVVAEGVEISDQLEILKQLQCWYIQGYYYNKPIPIRDFETLYLTVRSHR